MPLFRSQGRGQGARGRLRPRRGCRPGSTSPRSGRCSTPATSRRRPRDVDARADGEVEEPLSLTYDELRALPATEVTTDIHCVTRWSRFDAGFKGVHWRELAKLCKPKPSARFAIAHAEQGFTANVPLAALEDEHALVVYEADGEPLTPEHGWPVRLFVPSKYFWKSAKWLTGIELSAVDKPGLLGALRLPQRRRLLEGAAVRLLSRRSVKGLKERTAAADTGSPPPHSPSGTKRRAPAAPLRLSVLGERRRGGRPRAARMAASTCSSSASEMPPRSGRSPAQSARRSPPASPCPSRSARAT